MGSIEFPFFAGLPTVIVSFYIPALAAQSERRLLIDSGFTGKSGFVLNEWDAVSFKLRSATESRVSGALAGAHQRIWVKCSLPSVNYQTHLMAIKSDLTNLSLPSGIDGLAGLTFLKEFKRWGAYQTEGHWVVALDTPGNP